MTRKTSYIILIVILFIAVIGGGVALKKHEKTKREEAIVESYKPLVEKEVLDHYKVNKVTFTDYNVTPIGIIFLHGYVNEDKDVSFAAPLHKREDGNYDSDGFVVSPELDKLSTESDGFE